MMRIHRKNKNDRKSYLGKILIETLKASFVYFKKIYLHIILKILKLFPQFVGFQTEII